MNYAHLTLAGIAVLLFGVILGHSIATTAASVTGAVIDSPQSLSAASSIAMPRDRVSESQIIVTERDVRLDIRDASWSTFTDTNSMVPFLDTGANAIHVTPRYPEELEAGDIISYRIGGISVIHRITETGYDRQGWYAIAKGDNNAVSDPFKIRFEQIDRVLVAIIY